MNVSFVPTADKDQWEHIFSTYSPNALFQSWQWGEVMGKLGMTVSRYLIKTPKVAGIMQTVVVNAKRGTYLHIRHGPVFIGATIPLWQAFVRQLREFAGQERVWFVRISPLIADTLDMRELFGTLGFVPAAIHRMDAEYCWVLDITPSADQLLAAMRKSTRYDIRKAQQRGVTVVKSTTHGDLELFLALYNDTAARQRFVPHKGLREEFAVFTREKQALLLLGQLEGRVVSGAIILFCGNQAIYHHGASVHSPIPVSALVQWEAILEAKKRGFSIYNFWGIAPENAPHHPWQGITAFKKGFGGTAVEYIHAHDLPLHRGYSVSRGVEYLRRVLRGYD